MVYQDVQADLSCSYPCAIVPSLSIRFINDRLLSKGYAEVAMMSSSDENHQQERRESSEATKLLKPAPVPSIRDLTRPKW
jgi:hypothetical protein